MGRVESMREKTRGLEREKEKEKEREFSTKEKEREFSTILLK